MSGPIVATQWARHFVHVQKEKKNIERDWDVVMEDLLRIIEDNKMDYYKAKLCPYCPECADEAGEDVVDYPFVSTYCEIHNPEGVKVESEDLDAYWKEDAK